MLRRLHKDQPDAFAFTPANLAWAEAQITKYPEGRQASAIIPLLWRAQEQEGWLSRPAIEHIADMLGLAYIRALEVATFYFMFQLQPVGSVAHVQICGTTSCMICGAEDLMGVCQNKIAAKPHQLSADGKFSWEEVECLGSCSNAPMAQIGKDYYEDLTVESFTRILDQFAAGEVPVPGPQNGRYSCEPLGGLTTLQDHAASRDQYNASVRLAVDLGETVKRIDGTEVALTTPWLGVGTDPKENPREIPGEAPAEIPAETPIEAPDDSPSEVPADMPVETPQAPPPEISSDSDKSRPEGLARARGGAADDLKLIKGIGPALENLCNRLGFFHFDQIAAWTGDEIAWVDDNLEGFKGRVTRDTWVEQAKILAAGGETDFAKRAKKGDVD